MSAHHLIKSFLVLIVIFVGSGPVSAESLFTTYYGINSELEGQTIQIVSLTDNNHITAGAVGQPNALDAIINRGETATVAIVTVPFKVSGTGALEVSADLEDVDMLVPGSFLGTEFVVPHTAGSRTFHLYVPDADTDTQVTLTIDGVDTPVTVLAGQVLAHNIMGQATSGLPCIITSGGPPILVFQNEVRMGFGDVVDGAPVSPASKEIWGVAGFGSTTIASMKNDATVTIYDSDGGKWERSIIAGQQITHSYPTNTDPITGNNQGREPALRIVSDQPVAAFSVRDGDGFEATSFFDTHRLGTEFILPVDAQYVAIVCPELNTAVTLYKKNGITETQIHDTIAQGPAGAEAPGKLYFGDVNSGANIPARSIIESNKPIFVTYEAAGSEAEHNLLGQRHSYTVLTDTQKGQTLSLTSLKGNNLIRVGNGTALLNCDQTGSLPIPTDPDPAVERLAYEVLGSKPFTAITDVVSSPGGIPAPNTFAGVGFVDSGPIFHFVSSPYGDAKVIITNDGNSFNAINIPQGQVKLISSALLFNQDGSPAVLTGSTYIFRSTLPILVARPGWAYPLPPAAKEIWGIRSRFIHYTALEDNTSITVHRNNIDSTYHRTENWSLNAGQLLSLGINNASLGWMQGEGDAYRVTADKPIAVFGIDDNDGSSRTAFWDTAHLGRHYGIPTDTQYIAVVCPTPLTVVTLYDENGNVLETHTATDAISPNPTAEFPRKLYFGDPNNGTHIPAGSYLESSSPIYIIAESSATDDSHNLFGSSEVCQENVLVIVADDLGVDVLGIYEKHAPGANIPLTPNIDALAANGLQFENAWERSWPRRVM